MIGRLLLNYPDAARRIGMCLALAAFAAGLYGLGIKADWIGKLVPSSLEWLAANPAAARGVSAVLIALIAAANWKALQQLGRKQQIVAVWIELFVLLMLFFYSFDLSFSFIGRKIGFLVSQGVVTTLYISAISIAIATVIAFIGAIAKLSKNGVIYGLATFYTSLFRGLPLLMQIYIIYLGLPQVGYVIGAVPAGIMALSLCYGAYMTEIFRAGIESIPRGQTEGATALGLSPNQTMFLVILPQAMRVIVPPTGNQFIAMLKDSSLISVVGVWEIMYLARTQGQTEFRHIEMLITASMIYWLLSIGLEFLQSRIEERFGRSLKR
ncbi:amino acid ABC transporter permease [Mesorhizobium sp. M1A.F.Ca.IN.022.07.1.1]|uniref:amino acid ABC transporter permease n=7 Tax=Mesorhizobium TaxID=68287 RepID=UPI000BAE951C|nr:MULTISPECIES: amino acid ABC transporter permease [unclassified Mesorhizobium]TGV92017.1 amino acid ABC transporter permease [Mesorhizobium sp. M00.F.Ca.ET.158.01.1.1]AZO58558.1 amino acid ABC transporter permease [Mesorhizobium sp. M1A.F.Ca.IN.022.06.1.1]MCT2579334.1 amino acid ABC transporter permease [Mesorhizobium sp. P13.3]MDF3168492.1 amino acid ABC transporter permease [Mesorhizobium sp. P16.1]MDF3178091.1 amino acid ABC transporter permease [Mesorhizobium sp. P17.1]